MFNKMKGAATGAFGKVGKSGVAVAGVLALSTQQAFALAALPAGIATQLTQIQEDGIALADLVWPVLLILLGSVILMKLAKRFLNKV